MQVVKKQLRKYVQICASNEEYDRRIKEIEAVVHSEQWKCVVQILWTIKNEMAIELLESSKFTALSPDEKDRTQTVYANINEWINFLTSPLKWVRKNNLIQQIIKGRLRTQGEDRT